MSNLLLKHFLCYIPFGIGYDACNELKIQYTGNILGPLEHSVSTIGGKISNIALNEETDMHLYKAKDPIMLIGSNYGTDCAEGYVRKQKPDRTTEKKVKGRKPKPRIQKRTTRSKKIMNDVKRYDEEGNEIKEDPSQFGEEPIYLCSQITFEIKSPTIVGKLYKFKVFRDGVFELPGIVTPDYSDLYQPLSVLCEYCSKIFKKPVELIPNSISIHLLNCKTILQEPTYMFSIIGLGKAMEKEMISGKNPMRMVSVKYSSPETSTTIEVKFGRPTARLPKKAVSLKILRQKINFEGGSSMVEIEELYRWLNDFIIEHYDEAILSPNNYFSDSSDTDIE